MIYFHPDFSCLGHLNLPSELLCQALSYLLPDDLARLGTTCKAAQYFIQGDNTALWKQIFLNVFDPPRHHPLLGDRDSPIKPEFDGFAELKARYAAKALVLDQGKKEIESESYPRAIEVLLDVLDTTCTTPSQAKEKGKCSWLKRSRNIAWIESIFNNNSIAQRFIHDFHPDSYPSQLPIPQHEASVIPTRRVTRSMTMTHHPTPSPAASRLHVLYGLTRRERRSKHARGHARHLVYDWSLSDPVQDFGPFTPQGSTDWRMLEAIYSVVIRNFEATCVSDIDRHYIPTSDPKNLEYGHPHGFRCSVPNLILQNPSVPQDWARVTGNWLGTYSFLDYSDLFFFNAGFRPNPRPSLDDYEEACGDLMRLDLALVNPEDNENDPIFSDLKLQSSLPYDPRLPILYFRGTSQSALNAHAHHHHPHSPLISVRGRVNLMPASSASHSGREVRWRFIINYAGGDQWQLECVQPGGPGSGGVFGLWTHVDHEPGGPVGPVCYFPEKLCLQGRDEEVPVKRENEDGEKEGEGPEVLFTYGEVAMEDEDDEDEGEDEGEGQRRGRTEALPFGYL